MGINDWAWLDGRELLVSEIESRVLALRNSVPGTRAERGLNVGLLVFLERRLARMRGALGELSGVPFTASHDLRQAVDRMVSSAAATLWHAESLAKDFVASRRRPARRRGEGSATG